MWTRRDVLQRGLGAAAGLPLGASAWALSSGSALPSERVLVVVQLTGGNDGLNTVVPHRQDEYYRQRPTLGLKRGSLHALDEDHGLHPSMAGLGQLYQEGQLAVVHGVGSPRPDRSHFRSLEVWHTADPYGPAGPVGWLGRLADRLAQGGSGATPALAVEGGDLPLSMRGAKVTPPTVRNANGLKLHPASASFAEGRDRLCQLPGQGDLAYLRDVARSTYATAQRMEELVSTPSPVDYPAHDFARRLQLVARLVRGRFGTSIFHLSIDGFDTHAQQARVHADLLGRLSSGLSAFQRDLASDDCADRVLTFVFSEFGRRARENASGGTDHGQGAPVFLLGAPVRGGMHGGAPDLTQLREGDVPGECDFRRVYTTLCQGWMGLDTDWNVSPLPILS